MGANFITGSSGNYLRSVSKFGATFDYNGPLLPLSTFPNTTSTLEFARLDNKDNSFSVSLNASGVSQVVYSGTLLSELLMVNRGVTTAQVFINAPHSPTGVTGSGYVNLASGESLLLNSAIFHVALYDPNNAGPTVEFFGIKRYNTQTV